MNWKTAMRASALVVELPALEQLALERDEEALPHRAVVRIADRAHGRPDARLLASEAEDNGRILRSLVAVMDHVDRLALRQRHVERAQVGTWVMSATRHPPAGG